MIPLLVPLSIENHIYTLIKKLLITGMDKTGDSFDLMDTPIPNRIYTQNRFTRESE